MSNDYNPNGNGNHLLAYGEKEVSRGKNILIKIGATFAHKDGDFNKGFTTEIDAMPLNFNGRIVHLPPKDREQA